MALAIATVYFILFTTLSVLRHESYHSFGLDLGLFDQVFWNTTQGRPFESTMSLGIAAPHSLLGDHFSPVFLLLMPLYYAYPHPETLLVIQTAALALGAWPVYLLGKLKLAAGYPLLWVLVYFLFLPLAFINLYDFHEIALAVAPLGFALYFLERDRPFWFLGFLLFTFLIKEELPVVALGFGMYALARRNWRLGLQVLAGSLVVFELVTGFAIPHFSGGRTYFYFAERYGAIGGSPLGILHTLITNPLQIARVLIVPKKIYFLIGIFGPVLGLSALGGWAVLLLLPTLGYLLLTGYVPQFSFTSQYAAPLIPLVIGTAIIAMGRLPASALRYVAGGVLASSLVFSWAYGDLPYSRKFDWSIFETQSRYAPFVSQLSQIGPDARVSAEIGMTSHLSERRYIYEYSFEGVQDAQWVVLDYEGTGYNLAAFDSQVRYVESLGYEQVASGYGLSLLRKLPSG